MGKKQNLNALLLQGEEQDFTCDTFSTRHGQNRSVMRGISKTCIKNAIKHVPRNDTTAVTTASGDTVVVGCSRVITTYHNHSNTTPKGRNRHKGVSYTQWTSGSKEIYAKNRTMVKPIYPPALIGPGGKIIKTIVELSGCRCINVDPNDASKQSSNVVFNGWQDEFDRANMLVDAVIQWRKTSFVCSACALSFETKNERKAHSESQDGCQNPETRTTKKAKQKTEEMKIKRSQQNIARLIDMLEQKIQPQNAKEDRQMSIPDVAVKFSTK